MFLRGFHASFERGSEVCFVDNRLVEGGSSPISRTDEGGNTYQSRRLANGTTHEVLKNFPTEAEIRKALAGLGRDVQVERFEYYWVVRYKPVVGWRIDPRLTDGFKFSCLYYSLIMLLAGMVLDGGNLAQSLFYAGLAFFCCMGLIAIRRRRNPTRGDVVFSICGCLALCVLSFFLTHAIWRWRGVF